MEGILKVSVLQEKMIYYTVCVPPCLYKNKCHWENLIKSFFRFWSKLSHHPVQFSNWTETYQLGKVFQLDYFVPKKMKIIFWKTSSGLFVPLKFKHKIPLSSTYIIQFYKGDSPLGRKGKRVHSCNEWNSVANNDYIN